MHHRVSKRDAAVETAERAHEHALAALREHEASAEPERYAALLQALTAANAKRQEAHAMPARFVCRACKQEYPVGQHVLIVFKHVTRLDPKTGQWRNYFESSDPAREHYVQLCRGCDEALQLVEYPE